jgi:hypothetical protein
MAEKQKKLNIMKELKRAGLKPERSFPAKFDPRVKRDVEGFLRAKRRAERQTEKMNLVFD